MRSRYAAVAVLVAAFSTLGALPASAGGGFCIAGPVLDQRGTAVSIENDCFTPNVIRVDSGGSVTWTNNDSHEHTVTGIGLWGSTHTSLAPGKHVSYSFKDDGVYLYICEFHPGMVGAVIVGDGTGKAATTAVEKAEAPPAVPASGGNSDGGTGSGGGDGSPLFIILLAGGAAAVLGVGTWSAAYRLRARRSSTAPTTAP